MENKCMLLSWSRTQTKIDPTVEECLNDVDHLEETVVSLSQEGFDEFKSEADIILSKMKTHCYSEWYSNVEDVL